MRGNPRNKNGQILQEMLKSGHWSGNVGKMTEGKKLVADTPIFSALEAEKQLSIFK